MGVQCTRGRGVCDGCVGTSSPGISTPGTPVLITPHPTHRAQVSLSPGPRCLPAGITSIAGDIRADISLQQNQIGVAPGPLLQYRAAGNSADFLKYLETLVLRQGGRGGGLGTAAGAIGVTAAVTGDRGGGSRGEYSGVPEQTRQEIFERMKEDLNIRLFVHQS